MTGSPIGAQHRSATMPPIFASSYATATRYARRAKDYLDGTLLGDTGFFYHFCAFVLVIATLVILNLWLTPQVLWFYWPLLGWGIGVLAHGLAVNFSKEERVRRRTHARRNRSV